MSNVVSHDTNAMREWSNTMDEHSNNYDDLIRRFYALVDQFVGTADFKGKLSEDFYNNVYNQRSKFEQYSETFKECAELIKSRAGNIDSDEALLQSMINRANPLN